MTTHVGCRPRPHNKLRNMQVLRKEIQSALPRVAVGSDESGSERFLEPERLAIMSSPEEVAEGVKADARFIYFGIKPEVGTYVAPSNYGGYSNLDPWPMYKLMQYAKASEEAGTAHFLTIQVSDGTPLPVDRNANRLANNLGPPMGHPAFLHEFDRKLAPEFILLR